MKKHKNDEKNSITEYTKIRRENSGCRSSSNNNKNARPRSDSYAIRIIIFRYFATAICYRSSSYRLQSLSLSHSPNEQSAHDFHSNASEKQQQQQT